MTQQEGRLRWIKAAERLPIGDENERFHVRRIDTHYKDCFGLLYLAIHKHLYEWLENYTAVSVEPEGMLEALKSAALAYSISVVKGPTEWEQKDPRKKKHFIDGGKWVIENFSQFKSPVSEDEAKAKFAKHLGLKPGEELDTRDAYAVEWVESWFRNVSNFEQSK